MSTLAIPNPSFLGTLKNIGRGIYRATAKFAGYDASQPTATTKTGTRYGSNPNSSIANLARVSMIWTAEYIAKNSAIAAAYLGAYGAQANTYASIPA